RENYATRILPQKKRGRPGRATGRGSQASVWPAEPELNGSLPAAALRQCRKASAGSLGFLPRVDMHLNRHPRTQALALIRLAEHFDAHRNTLSDLHKV